MKRKILAVLFFIVVPLQTVLAEKIDGLPITVKIETSVNYPDGSVEITGVSNSLDDQPGEVAIELITPGGATINLSAQTDTKTGVYRVNYMPEEMGEYTVNAYAPDKTQTAQTAFTVTAVIDAEEILAEFDTAKDEAMEALDSALTDAIASEASAADIASTKQQLQKTKQKLKEFDSAWGKLKTAVKDMQELAKKHPEINTLAAAELGQLSSKIKEGSDVLRQVQKSLAESSSGGGDMCDKFYQISESCALFSTVMNVTSGGIIAIGKSIFIDKVWPKIEEDVGEKKFTAGENFLFTQAGKTGLSALDDLSSLKTKSFGAGMAGDLVQFVSKELKKKYCSEYIGPITGDYTLEFKNEGKTYLRYKLTYEGTISVYGRKDILSAPQAAATGTLSDAAQAAAGGLTGESAIPKLNGYIEGNVTKMEFTDDVWAVEDKSEWDEIKYQRIPAPIVPINASKNDIEFGAVARAAIPGSFYFPLEARLVQEKMVIKLMPARSEFTDAFANRSIVVVRAKQEPHNISGGVFHYPLTTAHFILTRTMRIPDDEQILTLDIVTKNGISTIEKDFTRTESPDSDTRVDFNLKLKLSNE